MLYRDRDIDANFGYLQVEEFIQVLNYRDLGLQLNEEELLYIAAQVDINVNGWIPLVQVVPQLPPLLLAIYKQRAEQTMVIAGITTGLSIAGSLGRGNQTCSIALVLFSV